MKKALTAAVAAVLAVSTVGVASAAEAQARHDPRNQHRYDQRHDRGPSTHARQNQRQAQQRAAQQRAAQQRAAQQRAAQQRAIQARIHAQQRYRVGAYQRPSGYQYRQWHAGHRLPPAYRQSRYVVDHRHYGLRAPPPGYQYTRVDNDVVLTAIATGLIASVIVGLFQ